MTMYKLSVKLESVLPLSRNPRSKSSCCVHLGLIWSYVHSYIIYSLNHGLFLFVMPRNHRGDGDPIFVGPVEMPSKKNPVVVSVQKCRALYRTHGKPGFMFQRADRLVLDMIQRLRVK